MRVVFLFLSWLACRENTVVKKSSSLNSSLTMSDPALVASYPVDTMSKEELMALPIFDLRAIAFKKKEDLNLAKENLAQLKKINQVLCERLNQLSSDCKTAVWLVSDGGESSQSLCESSAPETIVSSNHTVTVNLAANLEGKYYLMINDSYVSNLFVSGKTNLVFQTLGDANRRMRLMDAYKILVRRDDGDQMMPDLDVFLMSLSVDDVTVASKPLLITQNQDKLGYEYEIDLGEILHMSSSPLCKLDDAALKTLEESVSN